MMLRGGLAPPRGAAALWNFNHLAESGTENGPIDSFGFLPALSHSPPRPEAGT
jgi:hypothetical protein